MELFGVLPPEVVDFAVDMRKVMRIVSESRLYRPLGMLQMLLVQTLFRAGGAGVFMGFVAVSRH